MIINFGHFQAEHKRIIFHFHNCWCKTGPQVLKLGADQSLLFDLHPGSLLCDGFVSVADRLPRQRHLLAALDAQFQFSDLLLQLRVLGEQPGPWCRQPCTTGSTKPPGDVSPDSCLDNCPTLYLFHKTSHHITYFISTSETGYKLLRFCLCRCQAGLVFFICRTQSEWRRKVLLHSEEVRVSRPDCLQHLLTLTLLLSRYFVGIQSAAAACSTMSVFLWGTTDRMWMDRNQQPQSQCLMQTPPPVWPLKGPCYLSQQLLHRPRVLTRIALLGHNRKIHILGKAESHKI